tara:strand:- start:1397 stop:2215 length:819 start_codon:yes stop_codon:yes gene_type:complete
LKIFNTINEFNLAKENLTNLTFVPTMGNLHAGHTSLIDFAKETGNIVISTIYVNKLQFNDINDFNNYPKTLNNDIKLLEDHGCDYLLIPDKSILENIASIKAPTKSQKLCGKNRPGHFDGVLTILKKLFDIIEPKIVVFGMKDYQQFIIVKDFINNNNLNINIIGLKTIRETSGLALSSRNNLLSTKNKNLASILYQTLKDIETNKVSICPDLLNLKIDYLNSCGFKVDYLTSCDEESLEECFDIHNKNLLLAVAASIGGVRLIDNIVLTKL